MSIQKLQLKIDEQINLNTTLYKSIPMPSREDPRNENAEPILSQWRLGSEKLKEMLAELETLKQEACSKINKECDVKTFVNGFGDATKRYITTVSYERRLKRIEKSVLSFMGKS